ncbi:MAG: hypothetical protein OXF02_07555 [Simkaniaceae bacterium]|nr:hypothetical protein [Simkaniaceae bacterium]
MKYRFVLPVLAGIGALFALFMVLEGLRSPPVPAVRFHPPHPPYEHFIAGIGTVEPVSEESVIGAPFNEIVSSVHVQPGEIVAEGTPLFALDTRRLEALLEEAEQGKALREVEHEHAKEKLALYEHLTDKRAISRDLFHDRFYAEKRASAAVREAETAIRKIETDLERSIVRAPFPGTVLEVNIRVGEAINLNPFDRSAPVLFGRTDRLKMRVSIDEDDAWRVIREGRATAYARGNRAMEIPLTPLNIEPVVVPKRTLTGSNTEQVDTRVLRLTYEMGESPYPVYPGQVMDVYLEGLPLP